MDDSSLPRRRPFALRWRRRAEADGQAGPDLPPPPATPPPEWLEVAPEDALPLLERTLRQAEEWSLVLTARRVPHRLRHELDGWRVETLAPLAPRAMAELTAYVRENRRRPFLFIPRPFFDNSRGTLLVLASLVAFYGLTNSTWPGLGLYPHRFAELGAADNLRILAGEGWRLVTCLTLHADAAHVLGNAIIGMVFLIPVCRELGGGLGWWLVVVAGILGTLANALIHGGAHSSIGFSTAVFAAAGILGAVRSVHGQLHARSRWVPVAAGLALLSLLGFGGERTDVGAHILGFVAGSLLGFLAAALTRHRLPGPLGQWLLGTGALLLPVAAWWWAFTLRSSQ